ncbi:hypothetical protein TNCV_3158161 [Trichonephila clavipes]|nr:hypothetical protein TNCV_3158161 [Trichonephila clavipes]
MESNMAVKRDDAADFVQPSVVKHRTWCHHFQALPCNGNIPTQIDLKNQSSVVSWKGDAGGLTGQRFHPDDGVKAVVLNRFHVQQTSFFVNGILKTLLSIETSA